MYILQNIGIGQHQSSLDLKIFAILITFDLIVYEVLKIISSSTPLMYAKQICNEKCF